MIPKGTNILMITEAHFEAMKKSLIEDVLKAIELLKTPEPKEDTLIDKKTAASILTVSLSTVNAWIAQGRLAAYKTGKNTVRLKKSEVLNSLTKIETIKYARKYDY